MDDIINFAFPHSCIVSDGPVALPDLLCTARQIGRRHFLWVLEIKVRAHFIGNFWHLIVVYEKVSLDVKFRTEGHGSFSRGIYGI